MKKNKGGDNSGLILSGNVWDATINILMRK
jgi:hypothetical protein